jgi:hypothetical protein
VCFKIAPDAKPWTRKIVYKMVHVDKTGILRGPFRPVIYTLGKVKHRSKGDTQIKARYSNGMKAHCGIYVYDTLKLARAAVRYSNYSRHQRAKYAVLRCQVDPKDFLHASKSVSYSTLKRRKAGDPYEYVETRGYSATYEKVLPLELVK